MQGIVSPTPLELHKVSGAAEGQQGEPTGGSPLRPPQVPVMWSAGYRDKGPGDRRFRIQRVRWLLGKRSLREHDPTRRARGPRWSETL